MTEHLDRATGNSSKVLKYTFFMHICLVVGGLVATLFTHFCIIIPTIMHVYVNIVKHKCIYKYT